ncbi:MAG: hypothetical protein JWQ76_2749 [Ramlibacter sp.]|nr:hypothetical protein [Ramlibacter sp.]
MTHPRAGAFLALWNGIAAAGLQAEYETWHTFEHVPERVGMPGFLEARRYRADAAGQAPHYFTCYWLEHAGALQTPQYQELLDRPTPWSSRMRGVLRDFVRVPCALGGRHGNSNATHLVALHLAADAARFAATAPALLQRLVDEAAIVCAQWGSSVEGSAHPLGAAPAAGVVVLLEGLDAAALQATAHGLLRDLAAVAAAVSPPRGFTLSTQVRQDELQFPLTARQPARPELFQRFTSPGDKQ